MVAMSAGMAYITGKLLGMGWRCDSLWAGFRADGVERFFSVTKAWLPMYVISRDHGSLP